MKLQKLLAGTALTSAILVVSGLAAIAAPIVDLNGYTGTVDFNFANYESFLVDGAVTSTPAVGAQNFGVFDVFSITNPGATSTFFSSGKNLLVGVFNGINVTGISGSGSSVKTTNTGGVFQLYEVSKSAFLAAGGFGQGLSGYANASCALGTLCYNGVTNTAGGQLVLTMDLTPGISLSNPNATLTATVDESNNPPTGGAAFDGIISGPLADEFNSIVSGKDSFCPNSSTSCPGADQSTFALASQDPITGHTPTSVPEPASLALFGAGLLGFGWFSWRRRKSA